MSTGEQSEIKAKQEDAIVALLNLPTVKKAAEAIGVCEKTLHRWLENPEFAAAHRRARREVFSHSVGIAQKYSAMALNTLGKIMSDTSAGASARVSAATAIMKFARESIELDEMAGRLDEVEARLNATKVQNTAPYGGS